MDKAKIKAVFDASADCALATIHADGTPAVAIVGFADTPDFELIFGTSNQSRKYRNIVNNPNVAVAIGWTWPKTVQYEGMARELSGQELEEYLEIYFQKQPETKKFQELPTQVYIAVKPRLIRYSDFGAKPHAEIIELKF